MQISNFQSTDKYAGMVLVGILPYFKLGDAEVGQLHHSARGLQQRIHHPGAEIVIAFRS
jgi:hypothetical protein